MKSLIVGPVFGARHGVDQRGSGDVGLNPYYQSNYSYTWGSRAVTIGATWRIGKMELQSRAREGVNAPTL